MRSPQRLLVDVDAIPGELRGLPQWVGWRLRRRAGSPKPTKQPLNPRDGALASSIDPATWGTFDEASRCPGADGIGFVFTADDPYVGVDLDGCRDAETGVIEEWAAEIMVKLTSYTEVSPSGTGVHVIVRGSLPGARRRKGPIEMYADGRYFTMTGNRVPETPAEIADRSLELRALHAAVFEEGKAVPIQRRSTRPRAGERATSGDLRLDPEAKPPAEKWDALCENDPRVLKTFNRQRPDLHDQSPSSFDMAIASYTVAVGWSDQEIVDTLIAGRRKHRDDLKLRQDYYAHTIAKARSSVTPVDALDVGDGGSGRGDGSGGGGVGGAGGDTPRPVVRVGARQLRDPSAEATTALIAANDPPVLFVRGEALVRVLSDEHDRAFIDGVGVDELTARATEVIDFVRQLARQQRPTAPPRDVIANILAAGKWNFPVLEGISEIPFMRPDGTTITAHGYDKATRTFYAPAAGLSVAETPDRPSAAQIAAAGALLIDDLLGDFPFVNEASRANTVAALITPVVRRLVGRVPIHVIDKPAPGTGAGLLVDVVAQLTTGRSAELATAPTTEEEWQKVILATAMRGASTLVIDNLETQLKSAALASATTSGQISGRVLGRSEIVVVPWLAAVTVTGNNVALGGDLARRVYQTRLDAQTARPWRREQFRHPDLLEWTAAHRADLIAAILTLVRAWFVAGKPVAPTARALGTSFGDWAQVIGGTLMVAGIDGFLANADSVLEELDDDTRAWEAFLREIAERWGSQPFRVADLAQAAVQGADWLLDALPDELVWDSANPARLAKQLGWALRKRRGVRYGEGDDELFVEAAPDDSHTKVRRWVVHVRGLRGF